MAFGAKKTQERLIIAGDQVDLSRAVYAPDLSYTALEEDASTFVVTHDRIFFRQPLEVVSAVLEANGFATNLENLLSCFDSMIQGVRVRAIDKAGSEEPAVARHYIPCTTFQLPNKSKVGPLLKKFYNEIEGYEAELARLRSGEQDEAGGKKQTREQLKREIELLKSENMRLSATVTQLTEQLAQAMRSQAHVTKALESNNIIPPQLKPMLVRELSLQERTITLKAGRSTYVIPLLFLKSLPKIGDPCLLNVKDDHIIDAYFYENPGREFHQEMAEVLAVNEKSCKLRDSQRKIHIWNVKHPQEEVVFQQLKRGSRVILASIDEVLVKLSLVFDQNVDIFAQLIQEKQTVFHLERSRQTSSLPLFEGKE